MGNELVKYDAACRAIAEARVIDEVKLIRDTAQAIAAAARIAKNYELEINAAEIRIRAERRLGEMLGEQKRTVGLNPGTRPSRIDGGTMQEPPSTIPTLAEMKLDKKLSSRAQKLASIPEEDFEETLAEHREAQEAVTSRTMEKLNKDHKKKQDQAQQQESIEEIINADDFQAVCDIRHCSFETLLESLSPDVVVTDPPYPKEYLPLYEKLAMLCREVPLVAVMCGQSYLPTIIENMSKHLKYAWTLCYLTPGGQSVQQWQVKVNTFWKPVLLFGETEEWFGDVVKSNTNDNDKRYHGWGQSESGMYDLVSRITKPGDLVCDPFIGGGTTAVVSLSLGRKFIGCDTDKNCVDIAIKRSLEQCQMLKKNERDGEI